MKHFAWARMGPCLFFVCLSPVTCRSLVIWISSHNICTVRWCLKQKEIDLKVREPTASRILPPGLEPDAEDQQVQQRIAGFTRWHEEQWDLRTFRKFFQTAMSWVQYLLGSRDNLLQLWKKHKHGPSERQRMYSLNRCWKRLVKKVQDFHCHWSGGNFRETFQELREFKIRSIGFSRQTTITSTTWLCPSEKRMQTIATAHDNDPARPLNHVSQSTRKTARRTSIWGNWRIWPCRGSRKSHGETCRQFRHRHQIATERSVGFLRILQSLTICEFSKWGLVSVLQTSDGGCEQNTDSNSKCRYAQCVTTHTEQNEHIFITRSRVAQDCTSLCHSTIVIPVSCLIPCRTWRWPQAQVLTDFPHWSFWQSHQHTRSLVHDPYLPCEVPRQSGGSTQIPSITVSWCRANFLSSSFHGLTRDPNLHEEVSSLP